MNRDLLTLLQTVIQNALPMALSLVDDVILAVLARLGLSLPWLQWVSLALMTVTIIYWSTRLIRFLWQPNE